jgi:hypothetical protein
MQNLDDDVRTEAAELVIFGSEPIKQNKPRNLNCTKLA